MVNRRSSIGRRLVLVVLAGITITAILVTGGSAWRETSRYADAKKREISGAAHALAVTVADPLARGDRVGVLKALRAIGRIPAFTHAKVEDAAGRVVADLGNTVALQEDDSGFILFRSNIRSAVPIRKNGERIGTLTVLVNTSDLKDRLTSGLVTGFGSALLSALIGLLIATRMQRRITEPIERLTRTMSHVRETNDFTGTVEHRSQDETGVLVDTFNGMLAEIRSRDDRLERHRTTLEQTVELRTRDLRAAKDQAEAANAAKSDFLATMSHEIRTPMNGMLVMAELLGSADLSDRHRRYTDVIVKSGQSLLTIINDILDLSKIEAGKLALERVPVNVAEIVDDVLSLFWERAASKGLDLAAYVAPDVPELIEADPVRLNQVLSNLVNNALKFTEHGHVNVTVSRCAGAPDERPTLAFAVDDTGIGIAADNLATIFESFSQADQSTTRRFGGTGLGLAICRQLVSAMDGVLKVASVEGEGSTFSFDVPCEIATGNGDAAGSTDPAEPATPLSAAWIVTGRPATGAALMRYLTDRAVDTVTKPPGERIAAEGLDIVIADAKALAGFSRPTSLDGVPTRPFTVCLAEMGDSAGTALVEYGRADELLTLPLSHADLLAALKRLEAGTPLGPEALKTSARGAGRTFQSAHVLIADDSPVNREVVLEALKQLGMTADIAENGRAAVDAASREAYDLILMDCSMPEMDGFEATRRIRRLELDIGRGRVPVLALTAHVVGGAADDWRSAGMDDYLTKPFRLSDLADAFARFLPDHEQSNNAGGDRMDEESPALHTEPGPTKAAPADAKPPDDDLPVIDEGVLADAVGGDINAASELVARVLGLFTTHAPEAMLKLALTARDGGALEIAEAAHALKSMARNIGARRLAEACGVLEADAQSARLVDLPDRLEGLKRHLIEVLEIIDRPRTCAVEGHVDPTGPVLPGPKAKISAVS